jgi:hypothetical protein
VTGREVTSRREKGQGGSRFDREGFGWRGREGEGQGEGRVSLRIVKWPMLEGESHKRARMER